MTAYEEYLNEVKQYVSSNKDIIDKVNSESKQKIFPQHILCAKTVCGELENDKAKTLRINEEFYFTEQLVNKLMLFAFLKGRKDIDEKSYKKGWYDCRTDIANKLDFIHDDEN